MKNVIWLVCILLLLLSVSAYVEAETGLGARIPEARLIPSQNRSDLTRFTARFGAESLDELDEIILSEDFEFGLPDGWTVEDEDGGGISWELETANDLDELEPNFMLMNADSAGGGTIDNLITPSINCAGYSDIQLNFDSYFEVYEEEYAHIQLSTDGGETWTNIHTIDETDGNYPVTLDIAEWADGEEDVSIRFRYNDSLEVWGYYWGIDNVVVEGSVRTGTLAGTVTDSGQQAAIRDASVEVYLDEELAASAITLIDGTYEIPDLTVNDDYTVSVTADGYIRAVQTGVEITVGDTTTLDFALDTAEVVEFSGTLYSADSPGLEVAGATVRIEELGAEEVTGDQGEFDLGDHREGFYDIAVSFEPWEGEYHNDQMLSEVRITDEYLPLELYINEILPPADFAAGSRPFAVELTWNAPENHPDGNELNDFGGFSGYRVMMDYEILDLPVEEERLIIEVEGFEQHTFAVAAEYGYGEEWLVWTDSLTCSGGPGYVVTEEAFTWREIRTNGEGTALELGDEDYSNPISMGDILYEHFGVYFNDFTVSSNGGISLLNHFLSSDPASIPDTSQPNAILAPLWTDLDPSGNFEHDVWYHVDEFYEIITVQYLTAPFGQNGSLSFETVINQDEHTITFSYQSATGTGWFMDAVTGIENRRGTEGIQLDPATFLDDSVSIRFTWVQEYGGIEGTVWAENEGGDRLAGVAVILDGSPVAVTGLDGEYRFLAAGAGIHNVGFELEGYDPPDDAEILVVAAEMTTVNAVMRSMDRSPEYDGELPLNYALHQNYPNPFNPATTIRFDLAGEGRVKLAVYNVLGQEVAVLVNNTMEAGYHKMDFDASSLAAGIYFCRIETDEFEAIRKMVLLR